MRQGCPLSPILFNLYINDLLNDLNEYSFDSVHLSDKLQITCLAYAYDIILISKSALGLQNLLNCLHKFCEKWKMKVNTTKTKCITFQKKNKVNKSEIFRIGNANLSNVAEFVYLGLKINAVGSFKESLNLLGDKAKKACFSLNKNFKLKDIPIKIALKLFDATVLPILTYGAEVWAAFERADYDSWEKSPIEQVHLNFCKHILGVNRSTPNMLCRAELGRIPLKAVTDLKILGFFKHISEQNDDGLLKSAIETEKGIRKNNKSINLLMKFIEDINTIHEDNFHLLPKRRQKTKMFNMYQHIWRARVTNTIKGNTYSQFKNRISLEPYLSLIRNRKHMVQFSKLRLSDHKLMIELGRHNKIPREKRVCPLCKLGIEDEVHFTLKCQFFQKPRSTFLSALKKRCTSFSGLAENQKLHFLLTSENQQICNIFSRYLYELADMHEKSLSQKSQQCRVNKKSNT